MKRLFILVLAFSCAMIGMAEDYGRDMVMEEIVLQVYKIDDNPVKQNVPLAPMKIPVIKKYGQTFFLFGQFRDLNIDLFRFGVRVFSTCVNAGTNEVQIPFLEGCYEIQLNDGEYIYSAICQ